jgi:hypothetical protein
MRSTVGEIVSGHKLDWNDIIAAAHGCINYYAPKLSSVNVSGNKNAPLYVQAIDSERLAGCTIEELKVLEKVFGRLEAGENLEEVDYSKIDASAYSKTLQ